MILSMQEIHDGLNSVSTLPLSTFYNLLSQKNLSLFLGVSSSSSNLRHSLISLDLLPLIASPRHDGFQYLSLGFRERNFWADVLDGLVTKQRPSHPSNHPNGMTSCPIACSSSLVAETRHSFMCSWDRKKSK